MRSAFFNILLRHADLIQRQLGTMQYFNDRSNVKNGVKICCYCDLDTKLEEKTELERGRMASETFSVIQVDVNGDLKEVVSNGWIEEL